MKKQLRARGFLWLIAAIFVQAVTPVLADTLLVPDQYATIQAAIDAAVDGDVVEIADGTYTGAGNKDLDFSGKAITVRSVSGDPALCVIDCEGEGRGFYFHSGEGADSIVEGLTIRNGNTGAGGGVYCDHASPTLINCTITGNYANHDGGGVYWAYSSPTLTNCTISANSAGIDGGGICCDDSGYFNPTIANCTISGNSAGDDGGGIVCWYGGPTFTNCTIIGNSADDEGGGVFCWYSSSTLTNCTISGNSASLDGGGGVFVRSGWPRLSNCILWGDTPQEIYASPDSPVVTYCDVQGGWTGDGNIDADPLLAFSDDVHLMSGSPCIDAGTNDPSGGLPTNDLDGNPRPLDGDGDTIAIADMGAYEFNPAAPSIALTPARFEFSAPAGGDNPTDQVLALRNCGGGTLNWDVTGQPAWLTVTPPSGESYGEVDQITLGVDISGLSHGLYSAALEVADPLAVNSPREVIVKLYLTDTLYVPGGYPTIQAAIDAAIDGDIVEIADGRYSGAGNKNLDFGGKAIAVRSASGDPALCIIDCEGEGRGFYFHRAEGPGSIVMGLTITNGYFDGGDSDDYSGGGIYCTNSSGPTLIDCTIRGNSAHYGGGVCCRTGSHPTLTNCTISRNSARHGGGICCYGSDPTLADSLISGNLAFDNGGGVCCHGSDPTLANSVIGENQANDEGGGIYCNFGSPTLTSCTIAGNSADTGGGIHCYRYSDPTLTNCTISRNSADTAGGIHCDNYSDLVFTNCTICENSADNGGGIFCSDNSRPTLTNCVLWGDTPQEIDVSSSEPVVTFCDVQGGWTGEGNIDADPLLAFSDDLHLMAGSPCVDGGTNDPAGGLPDDDLDGNARSLDGDGDTVAIADMGAYEFNPAAPSIALTPPRFEFSAPEGGDDPADQVLSLRNCGGGTLDWEIAGQPAWLVVSPSSGASSGEVDQVTISVDISATPHGAHAAVLEAADAQAINSPREVSVTLYVTDTLHVPGDYPTIQAAIEAAIDGDIVEIADGTYTGAGNKNLDFGGKAITARSGSGDSAQCVIDCENDGRGFHFHSGEEPDSIVEGLTITNGYLDGTSPDRLNGGGVYCVDNSSPTLINCVITGNSAADENGLGGGVYCRESSPTFTNCVIAENSTTGGYGYGGGVLFSGGGPALTNCAVTDNAANVGGGCGCYYSSRPTFTNCAISGNSASDYGGGICCGSNGSPTLTNCTITGNSTGNYDGGGLATYSNINPTLTNCTITGNSANRDGGGIYCYTYADCSATLTNSILWGNTAGDDGPQIFGHPSVTYCDVQGGWTGTGNIDVDPLFVDPDGPDDDPNTWEDNDYRLSAGSPCIDAGCSCALPPDTADLDDDGDVDEFTPFDLDGEGRFFDDPATADTGSGWPPVVDMGAYEFGDAGPQPCPGDLDGDRDIDLSDLAALLPSYGVTSGATYVDGDLDCDGDVDLADLAALLAVYRTSCE